MLTVVPGIRRHGMAVCLWALAMMLAWASWMPSCTAFAGPRSRTLPAGVSTMTDTALASATTHDSNNDNNNHRKSIVCSVNYFISRRCNYACKFCFHTQKNSHHLDLAAAQRGLALLRDAGTEKINFAGGEPFLHPTFLGQLCQTAHQDLGMAVSMYCQQWIAHYGRMDELVWQTCRHFGRELRFL